MRQFTDFARAKDNKLSKTGFTNKDVASSLSTYESLFYCKDICGFQKQLYIYSVVVMVWEL